MFELKKLSISDGMDIYEILQEIPKDENGAVNSINGRSSGEFKQWLIRSEALSKAKVIDAGWKVPTNVYWLYVDGYPVGFGKLRHFLTDRLREEGGHVGYAIRPSQRNKGYGTMLLRLIIEEAKKMYIDKILLTIRNENVGSIKVALNNNGKVERVSKERQYIWIDC